MLGFQPLSTAPISALADSPPIVVPDDLIGSINFFEIGDSATATGTVVLTGLTGTISATEESDTLSASGVIDTVVSLTGSINFTESDDTASMSGNVEAYTALSGSVNFVEENDSVSASGVVTQYYFFSGSIEFTEEDDTTSTDAGIVTDYSGSIVFNEENDTTTSFGVLDGPGFREPTHQMIIPKEVRIMTILNTPRRGWNQLNYKKGFSMGFVNDGRSIPRAPFKDPDSVIDYGCDFTEWLDEGETIDSSTWLPVSGLTLTYSANTGYITGITVTGGEVGKRYILTNRVTTTDGRIEERSMRIVVKQK